MKNTRKLLALVLAMVMAFSLMAVTAAAAEEHDHDGVCSVETIQPRKPGAPQCVYCGYPMTDSGSYTGEGGPYTLYVCKNPDCGHNYSMPVYR